MTPRQRKAWSRVIEESGISVRLYERVPRSLPDITAEDLLSTDPKVRDAIQRFHAVMGNFWTSSTA